MKHALLSAALLFSCSGMVTDLSDAGEATGGGTATGGGSASNGGGSAANGGGGSASAGGGGAGSTGGGSVSTGGGSGSVGGGTATGGGVVDSGQPYVDAGSRPIFIIGGQDERHLISMNGTDWQHDTYVAPNGMDNAYGGIAVGNGAIVMSGDPGIVRSTDGITFAVTQQPPSRFSFHGSVAAFANGVFVVIGQADAWRSADGITWDHAMNTGNAGHWQSLAYGNGHWVVFGDGYRKTSEDGLTWHDYTTTPDPDPVAAVSFGNGVFVAVGLKTSMGRVLVSTDTINWTEQPLITTQYSTGFAGIAFGNGHFLTNDCCNAFESTDGVTWTKRGTAHGAGLVFAGGTFVGSGLANQRVHLQ